MNKKYGNTLVVNDPLLVAHIRLYACRTPAEEAKLRKTPEGRKHLLLIAKERRKEPLYLRRLPRMLGQAFKKNIDKTIDKALKI